MSVTVGEAVTVGGFSIILTAVATSRGCQGTRRPGLGYSRGAVNFSPVLAATLAHQSSAYQGALVAHYEATWRQDWQGVDVQLRHDVFWGDCVEAAHRYQAQPQADRSSAQQIPLHTR
jgi:hypothetical protein